MFNWRTLEFGAAFSALDTIALPITKSVSKGTLSKLWMLVPALLYGASPFVFLKALEQESLTIMNLVWDLTSDLTVTFIGLVVFAERIAPTKLVGVCFSLVGLFLMSYENTSWNDYLTRNYRYLTGTTAAA